MQRNARKQGDSDSLRSGFEEGSTATRGNPFKHRLRLSKWDWMKTFALTIFILPIRIFVVVIFIILLYLVARIGLLNLDQTEYREKPFISHFRRLCQKLVFILTKVFIKLMGFSVKIKGTMAEAREAPILIAAPHSTYWDLPVLNAACDKPYTSVFASEFKKAPLLGKITEILQPIYLNRFDSSSREYTKREILRRVSLNNHQDLNERWPQLLFSPEGMCSNRTALLPFKLGAFNPGKPVQPVMIRYPNKIDTVTWTRDQSHGPLSVFWLTLTQPMTHVVVEFLPVYNPNPEEQEDPVLYASNVRNRMAAHYDVPIYDLPLKK